MPCRTEPISYPTTCRNWSMAELQLVAKLRTSSPVWTYFGFEATDDGKLRNEELAVCRLCTKKVSTKGRNTSNLFSHLRSHHPTEYNIVKEVRAPTRGVSTSGAATSSGSDSTQPTIADALTLATKYPLNSKRWKELTNAITFYITKDMLSLYTVEKPGFKRLLTTFDSRYQLASRSYFSRTAIPALYAQVRERIHGQLRHAKYFSATTDLGSSLTVEHI